MDDLWGRRLLDQRGRQPRRQELQVTDELTLGGEIYDQTADNVLGNDAIGFNLGGTYDFDEQNHLNVSLGRELQASVPRYDWYFGLGNNLLSPW